MSWAQRLGLSNSDSVLCDRAMNAETRLSCIKKVNCKESHIEMAFSRSLPPGVYSEL